MFIRKNSVVYVENNVLRCRKFSVSVHPFKWDRVLIFSVSVRYTVRKRQRRYGTAVRTQITETGTNERIRNAGNRALNVINVRNVYNGSKTKMRLLCC